MSKKTVISDFTALKGKVTFSEASGMQESAKKKASEQQVSPAVEKQSKTNESHLKIGQSVVLMDSDLRGKIVSIGRKVLIELEDGLTIEAAYGEFAVTDATELKALKSSKVKAKKTSVPSKQASVAPSASTLAVDLHIEAIPGGRNVPKGQQLQFQIDTFKRIVRENLSHRGMKISFIHGIGDGILKAAIRKELDEVLALRCSYSVGDPAVTTVCIK